MFVLFLQSRNFATCGLQVVGSTMSGFGGNTSDVDMCLLIRSTEVDQRYEAVDRLQALWENLKRVPGIENQELIYAKVPILKFRDSVRRLEVDLNCNNFVGIRNTHLQYAYAQMDWRLKPLVLVVKMWAKYHKINDAKNMTISSYSLVLMVIHFLQFGLTEPVLPCLHQMYPEKFSNQVPIMQVKMHEIMPPWESSNRMSLGELLTQFLEYFARKFEYVKDSVLLGFLENCS
jgi:poly(A) RNA polymerase GLD2